MESEENLTSESKNRSIGTREAARLLGVGCSTIQRWIDSGHIRAHRTLGGHRRMLFSDLMEAAIHRGLPLLRDVTAQRRKVLIVDDEPDVADTLAVRIKGLRPDLEVLTAESGFKAGVLASLHAPQLVLLDIRMPGMNGIEVCKVIKEHPLTAHTHVVGITAYRDTGDVEALKAAGASDVFFKPFEPEALAELLDRLLPTTPRSGVKPSAPATGRNGEGASRS